MCLSRFITFAVQKNCTGPNPAYQSAEARFCSTRLQKIMEHVNIAMYIKNYGEYIFCICCIFCIFCIFWYGGIFYILYILYCSVYRTRVEYCTFCVVRRSFQALFHITSSPHKHPFFLGVFTIIHHQSSSFITKCQKITCWP